MVVHALPDVTLPEQPVWGSRAWSNSGAGLERERRGREAALAGAALVLAAYAYLGGSLVGDARSLAEVDNRLGEIQHRAAPVIADREQALANLDYLSGFAKLDPYPSQLTVLPRIPENLPRHLSHLPPCSSHPAYL